MAAKFLSDTCATVMHSGLTVMLEKYTNEGTFQLARSKIRPVTPHDAQDAEYPAPVDAPQGSAWPWGSQTTHAIDSSSCPRHGVSLSILHLQILYSILSINSFEIPSGVLLVYVAHVLCPCLSRYSTVLGGVP